MRPFPGRLIRATLSSPKTTPGPGASNATEAVHGVVLSRMPRLLLVMAPQREHGRRAISRPFLVEITGVAGAGKSTLTRTLCNGAGDFHRGAFIHTRTPSHLMYVARSIPRLLPILIANLTRKPRLSWPDFKLLVYVTEWSRFLGRQAEYRHGVVLLDQGPMYALVRLKMQGRGVASSPSFLRWWNEMLAMWTNTLSAIVWLDAADGVLQTRIQERAQAHTMQGEPEELGREFIARYRVAFEASLRDIGEEEEPRLLRFDTSDTSTDLVAAEIRRALATHFGSARYHRGRDGEIPRSCET